MLPELLLQPFPLRPPGQARPELTSKVGTQDWRTLNQTKASIISVIIAAGDTCV